MSKVLAANSSILFIRPLALRTNRKFVFSSLLFLTFCLLVCYFFQINALTAQSYSLQEYQDKIEELETQNGKLEVKLASLDSLSSVESLAGSLEYEKITKINYVQIMEASVAAVK
jgi:hypothetical protein